MSPGTATVSGTKVLRIKIDFLFVYAVESPGQPAGWMRVVQHRTETLISRRGTTQAVV